MTIDSSHNSNRVFQGNPNYLDFYNREVKKFFNRDTPDIKNGSKLSTSKINATGQVIYKIEEGFEDCGGTIWRGVEKENFFQCLARYSISRVDLIKENLPTKSELEIINYYTVLKKELKSRKLKEGRRKRFKIKFGGREPKSYKFIKHSKHLICYSKIPIAFEVSPYFIKFEETQSILISKFERSKSNDENQRFKKFLDQYIGIKNSEPLSETQELINLSNIISQDSQQELNEEESLINYETALSLSNNLYKYNTITPVSTFKLVPKLHYKSIVFLEELAVIKLKSTLYDIIETKLGKNWLNKRQKSKELKINLKDVNNSLESMKDWKPSHTNLASYFSELRNSLNIDVVNDMQGDLSVMSDNEFKAFISNKNKLRKNNEPRKSKHMAKLLSTSSSKIYKKDPFYFKDDQSITSITGGNSQIPHISSFKNTVPRLSNEYPPEVEEELVGLESVILESKDILNSRVYEHSLLTYLSTNGSHEERVSNSMFDNKEAIKQLSQWVQEDSELKNDISENVINGNDQQELQQEQEQENSLHRDSESEINQIDTEILQKEKLHSDNILYDVEVEESLLKNFDYEYSHYSDDDSMDN